MTTQDQPTDTISNPTGLVFEQRVYKVGTYFLSYLINGDASGLEDDDQTMVDEWFTHAKDDWRDADDNLWVYSHMDVDTDNGDEFAYDEISMYYGTVVPLTIYFTKGN